MSNNQQFDLLIIGSGEAGKNLAWTMAKAGQRTAVVERKLIGGSCPNIACLPMGFTGFGTEARELMGGVQIAMLAKQPYTLLRDAILAHPTMAEGLAVLFDAIPGPSESARDRASPARTRGRSCWVNTCTVLDSRRDTWSYSLSQWQICNRSPKSASHKTAEWRCLW